MVSMVTLYLEVNNHCEPIGSIAPLDHETGSFLLADLRRSYHNGTYDILSNSPTDLGL
jgi:hypothetical protein